MTFGGASVLPHSYYTIAVRLHHLVEERQHDAAFVKSNVGLEQFTDSSDEDETSPTLPDIRFENSNFNIFNLFHFIYSHLFVCYCC